PLLSSLFPFHDAPTTEISTLSLHDALPISFDCSLYNKVIVMHPMLNIAIRAARSAGNVIAKACGQMDLVQTTQKGTNDFVTNIEDRKSTRLNSSHVKISYAVFCLKKKTQTK